MKKVSILMVCVVFAAITSCSDYLDINDNPNRPTKVDAALILPQALTTTANVLNGFNTYGSQIGGYAANAGGFGGFNETVSYAYTPSNYAGGWGATYDNLQDYQYIIDQTEGDPLNTDFNAVARIMKVHGFQLLIDAYNDVPYTESLKGVDFLTPKYDDAATTYATLATELDLAIATINANRDIPGKKDITEFDIVFGGDLDGWVRLANTIKLRLMVRGQGKVTFANANFDPIGFIGGEGVLLGDKAQDALINPGFTRDVNRQNPIWNTWGFAYTGSAGNKAWIPTTYVMTFYNGVKLDDSGRGAAIYYQFPATGTNQLGYESTGIPKSPDGSFWYPGTNRVGTSAGASTGVMKGPDAGYPLFTVAESKFLQAEATLIGLAIPTASSTKQLFEEGIATSFKYLYSLPDATFDGDWATDATAYFADNNNDLVRFDLATTNELKLRAIITQKYIALNMIHSHEGWNEYRRTGYPEVVTDPVPDPELTFASKASQSTRPDKLPTRILYPTSEFQYNSGNVPKSVNSFSSLIFWAK